MKLVLNIDKDYDVFGFEATAKLVKDAGFDAVDCGLFKMTDAEHELNGPDWYRHAMAFRQTFEAENLPIVQTHAPFSFKNCADPVSFAQEIYPKIVRSIEVSAALGAKYVIVHPFHYVDCNGNPEQAFEWNMKFYRSLIPVCKANGIKVCLENMFSRDKLRGNCITHDSCSRVEEFCRYIDALDSEYMVACLDIGHTMVVSGGADTWDFIRILGKERLHTLHVHDNNYKQDSHVTPFNGQLDWYKVCEALGEIDYQGDFVYECLMNRTVNKLAPRMYPTALSYMEKVGRHLINQIEAARVR